MKNTRLMSAAIALSASLAASGTSSAVSIFIGDAAADGLTIPVIGGAFSVDVLTIVNLAGTSTALSSPTASALTAGQTVTPTTVNFAAQSVGTLTPFIALITGANLRDFASYTILAVGDGIVVDASSLGLINADFTVGGAAAGSFDIPSDGQLVAGFVSEGSRLVGRTRNTTGIADIVLAGIGVTSASVGSGISDPIGTNFDQFPDTLAFNIGIDVVPEPTGVTLLGVTLLGGLLRRRR